MTFNEAIIAGTGNIEINNATGASLLIDVTDNSKVRFGGKNVVITPGATLALGSSFSVKIASGVVTDLAGNTYAGITDNTSLNFSATAAPAAKLLITEVNSNANGCDFLELYNFGTAAVNLTGRPYNDSAADEGIRIGSPGR